VFFQYITQKVFDQRHSQSKQADKTQKLNKDSLLPCVFTKHVTFYLDRLVPGPHKENKCSGGNGERAIAFFKRIEKEFQA